MFISGFFFQKKGAEILNDGKNMTRTKVVSRQHQTLAVLQLNLLKHEVCSAPLFHHLILRGQHFFFSCIPPTLWACTHY